MCGRYVLAGGTTQIAARFGAQPAHPGQTSLPVSFNVAPTRTMPVIVAHEDDDRLVALMRWGIVPRWRRDGTAPPPLINARAETVAEKPSFRKLLRTRRCLVPASGFFEWEKRASGKVPHYFSVPDLPLIAYAGLYDEPAEDDGETVGAYTILTTAANDIVAPFHDRMPVILRPEDEDLWLDPDIDEPAALEPLYAPFPPHRMREWAVSPRVNNARVDGPDVLERAG